jgi:hypothetical protein
MFSIVPANWILKPCDSGMVWAYHQAGITPEPIASKSNRSSPSATLHTLHRPPTIMKPVPSVPAMESVSSAQAMNDRDRETDDELNTSTYTDHYRETDEDLTDHAPRSANGQPNVKSLLPLATALFEILAANPLKPYESVPCANIDINKDYECPEKGISRCGGCALVYYCSQVSS